MNNRMVYRITAILLAAVMVIIMLPAAPAQAQATVLYGTITNAYLLNVRSGPGVNYGVVRKAALGEAVTLVGRNDAGTWVQLQAGGQEWVNAYYVATSGSVFVLPVTSGGVGPSTGISAVVSGSVYLNTRIGPGATYPIHQRLSNGQALTLVGRNSNASWVQIASGSVEWVNAAYLTIYGDRFSLPVSGAVGTAPGDGAGGYTDPFQATIVNAYYVNVRSGPSATFPVVRRVANGDQVKLIGRNANGSWVQLQPATGGSEWINASFVRTNGGVVATLPVNSASLPSAPYTPPGGTTGGTVRTHVVMAGENLYRIALYYGVSLPALAAYNGIYDYNRIYAGQVLVIP